MASCCHKQRNSTLTAFYLCTTRGSTVIHTCSFASVTCLPQRDRCFSFSLSFQLAFPPTISVLSCLSMSLRSSCLALCWFPVIFKMDIFIAFAVTALSAQKLMFVFCRLTCDERQIWSILQFVLANNHPLRRSQ